MAFILGIISGLISFRFFGYFGLGEEANCICSVIIGCSTWIVQIIKRTNPQCTSSITNLLRDKSNII